MTGDADRVLHELRAEIDRIDEEIFAALNRRLDVVARLKRHKDDHGLSFLDADRERRMIDERVRSNAGPLSEAGVRRFYAELLAVVKRELGDRG
jgi:chorismate mutase / prephenate dehydratase